MVLSGENSAINILYVDDETSLLDLCKIYLEKDGDFTVDTVTSAVDALEYVNTKHYDAIVSDFLMPDMDGIEFLKHIRSSGDQTPFIIFTGRGREDVVIEAINNGADYYLQKGGDTKAQFAELIHKIRQAVYRRKTELDLKQSEEKFYKLFMANPSLEAITDFASAKLIDVNEAFIRTTGYDREELIGKSTNEINLFVDHAKREEMAQEIIKDAIIKNVELRIQTKSGDIRTLDFTGHLVRVDDKALFFSQAVDITERKKAEEELLRKTEELEASYEEITATEEELRYQNELLAESEEALRKSEERYRKFFMASADTAFGSIHDDNLQPEHLLLIEDSRTNVLLIEHMLQSIDEISLSLDTSSNLSDGLDRIAAGGIDLVLLDLNLPDSEGIDTLTKLVTVAPHLPVVVITGLDDESLAIKAMKYGAQDYLVKGSFDSDALHRSIRYAFERKMTEARVRDSEIKYRALFNFAPVGISVTDHSGKIYAVNPAFTDMTGYSLADYVLPEGITITYADPGERERVLAELNESGRVRSREIRLRRKDGSVFNTLLNVDRFETSSGSLLLTITKDITERKQTEVALKHANEKIQLLSGITRHDILNQITALSGYLLLVENKVPADCSVSSYINDLKGITATIKEQIIFTRDYQNLGGNPSKWQSVADVARRAASGFDQHGVDIVIETGDLAIFADPMLERVFYNLYDNSFRHGGYVNGISVAFREGENGEGFITVQDNGTGIPEAMKEPIFSRGVGSNTGLGLFLVREILDITQISIRETGVEGEGARFEIVVPEGNYRYSGSE